MSTHPCFFSINAFYKVNVACDCLCLGFHFFSKGPNLCVNFVQVGARGNQLTVVKPNSYNMNDSNLLDWFIM
jgi:hypothetical protein